MCLSKPPKMPQVTLPTAPPAAPPPEQAASTMKTADEDSYGRLNNRHKQRTSLRIERTPSNASSALRI